MAFRGGNRGGRRPSNRGRGPPNKRGGDRRDVLMNEEISASEVRVIGEDKEALGVMGIGEALELAEDAGVDLLLVVPDASPPVCRLCEYSKYKYEKTKAEKDAKKKQRESVIEVKELKMRPGTDVHDYQVRVRAAQKFIDKNFRVKLTLQFRGREMEFKEIGREMFERFVEDLGGEAVVNIESPMRMQGRYVMFVVDFVVVLEWFTDVLCRLGFRQMNMVISKKEGATVAVNSGGPGEARGGDDLVDEEVAGEEVAASEESEETVV